MARECTFCGKKTVTGRRISHAHNVTRRSFQANLQHVRALVGGTSRRVWACTRCLRSGRVRKPPLRAWEPQEEITP